jgi:hypothetical protein
MSTHKAIAIETWLGSGVNWDGEIIPGRQRVVNEKKEFHIIEQSATT